MSFSNLLLVICLVGLIIVPFSVAKNAASAKEFVDAHNAARAEVGVEPLVWNKTLAIYARDYARSKKATCEMEHSNGPYGECLAEGFGMMTATEDVNLWVSEKKYYDHASNKCIGDECRHYTQVVWRNTKYIGCARVKCNNNWTFVICNYGPPGNYEGESPY